MLGIRELKTGYGKKQVLFGLSMELGKGEIVALIGPNGAGKSTVLKAICGLAPIWKGEIQFGGDIINGSTPEENVARGITFIPQGNRVFTDLTVSENLDIGGFQIPRKEAKSRIAIVLNLFPVLKEHARQEAGRLSGGEQQMLSFARALLTKPRLLLLDEPSLGLSPNIVKDLFKMIVRMNKEIGTSVFIVEQKVREVLKICDRVYALKMGKITYNGNPKELINDSIKLKQLFI